MSLTIRPAVASDDAAIQRMSARFLSDDGPYGSRYATDPVRLAATIAHLVSSDDSLALLALDGDRPVGMFALFCVDHPIIGKRIASEICWWIEPEARGTRAALRMHNTGKAWARDHGAYAMDMIAPTERVGAFYERLGYQRGDTHYMRLL